MGEGVLFVVSAPSGAGKSTLIERVRPLFPDMRYSISCTTRSPRSGEVQGVHYYFVERRTFEEMIPRGDFLEWKEVHGNLYGTPAGPVKEALGRGDRMILDIDVHGAQEVFRKVPRAVGIFITVPDLSVLEHRLRTRATDSPETIATRLKNAPGEISIGLTFPYVIVNDNLDTAVEALATIIRGQSRGRQSSYSDVH